MNFKHAFRDFVQKIVVSINIFKEFQILSAQSLLTVFKELMGRRGIVEYGLEDFLRKEVGEFG